MAPLPSRKELEALKRPELQALCKDYGVKANLKTDALIELLLDTKKTNTRGASAPATRRSVSTRQPSRSAPRISSVIIHDTDDEEEEENDQKVDEEETENQPEPEPIPSRTRKAKDTQTRLGVGRPVAAGGNGPRAVTKSVSVAKGKRGRNSKAVKPVEETIPEEVDEEQPLQGQAGPSNLAVVPPAAAPSEQPTPEISTLDGSTLASAIADALQPVYQQIESLKSELEQLPRLKSELVQLRKQAADVESLEQKVATLAAQVDILTAQSVTTTALDAQLKEIKDTIATNSWRSVPNPSTPRFSSPAPRPSIDENANASSSNSKTISPIKNHELPNPPIAPSLLGKRNRESSSSNLTGIIDEGQEGDLSEEELAKRVVRPTKKRPRLQEEPAEIEQEADAPSAPRVPSFTVFSGEEEEPYIDPPPPTEGLPEFYASSSGSGSHQGATTTTTSTQNASENQHPFTFAFLPISSTPAGASAFELPSFPYPEPPQSPTPAGPSHSGPARNHGERTDIFGSFGLPPPGRPRSRVTSTSAGSAVSRDGNAIGSFVDPAALTRRASQEAREDPGFGAFLRDGDGDAQALKRTMYGTELDGDTRFGDFGLEGVASGFNWGGGRF
ncbi:hypothetical protein B0H14DRAFT_3881585 [Mycena olivaceomarginata]|nr:hypothetical protein B0H14DRAFT_3881585 [Mycena olivaceomarginata]